jgi:hypothetical protein
MVLTRPNSTGVYRSFFGYLLTLFQVSGLAYMLGLSVKLGENDGYVGHM